MTAARIRHVNAFTTIPFEGNPAAVVDGEAVDPALFQRIALNQHLSETVFLLPPQSPENHVRARIFTPALELSFAGHPIIATAHAIVSEGRHMAADGPLRIETGAGVIPVDVETTGAGEPPRYTMTQATPTFRPATHSAEEIASWIGLDAKDVVRAEHVSTGFEWLIAQIASLEALSRARPSPAQDISMFCLEAAAPEAQIRVRTFAPLGGIIEDPVTGSSNGCIGALIARHGLLKPRDGAITYVAEQGIEMGQPGRIFVSVDGPSDAMRVRLGGHAVTTLEGSLILP